MHFPLLSITELPWLQDSTIELEGEARCPWCCYFALNGSKAGLGKHQKDCERKPRQSRGESKTVQAVRVERRKEQAAEREHIVLHGEQIRNEYSACSLGSDFTADGDPRYAMNCRANKARGRFNDLYRIWKDDRLPQSLKIKLYRAGVCSMLCHGYQSWLLDLKNKAFLRNWNAKCLAAITGRSVYDETREPTFNLIDHLRARRIRWVGHVLRMDSDRPAKQAIMTMQPPYTPGSVLDDAPPHTSLEELCELAQNKEDWRTIATDISPELDLEPEPLAPARSTKVAAGPGSHWGFNISRLPLMLE